MTVDEANTRHDRVRQWAGAINVLTRHEIDLMAHALGWPDTMNVDRPRSRVKWANPYRNHFITSPASQHDRQWSVLVLLGFAERVGVGESINYRVTPSGMAVTRAALLLQRLAKESP